MRDKTFLMIPGPTPVPQSVLLSMARQPIGHRSHEFSNILKDVYSSLKTIFNTKNDVFVYTSSGTGAMDAAISNLINPGDTVLSLICGNFGNRFAKIAQNYGANVIKLKCNFGEVITEDALKNVLSSDKEKKIKFVTLTHSETSTGVKNDIKALVKLVKDHGAISIVDGVTSVLAMPIKMDDWGIDVLISGSQKGFMVPPGLSFLALSEKAYEVSKLCKRPSFYFNFELHKKAIKENSTPFTPNVNLIIALKTALDMIEKEGLENIYARHYKHSFAIRQSLKKMNLELFVKNDNDASCAITSVIPPDNISVFEIRSLLKEEYDIVVANGQNELKDKIFRIGTLGFVSNRDVIAFVSSLESVLYKLGHKFELGLGISECIRVLNS